MVKTTNRLLEKTNLRKLFAKSERYHYQLKTLLFCLFFICTLNSFSQVELKGKVIDFITYLPLKTLDSLVIANALKKPWSDDIFIQRPYNKEFWKNYNVLLESEEEKKLVEDLSKRATLFRE